jgi:DNA topoisomerase-3
MVWDLTQKVIRGVHKTIELKEEKPEVTKEKRTKKETNWSEISCPKCKNHSLIQGKAAVGCTDFKNCQFKIPFEVFGKKLSEKQLLDLIKKGKTSKLKGFKAHPEDKSEGVLSLNSNFEIVLQ